MLKVRGLEAVNLGLAFHNQLGKAKEFLVRALRCKGVAVAESSPESSAARCFLVGRSLGRAGRTNQGSKNEPPFGYSHQSYKKIDLKFEQFIRPLSKTIMFMFRKF
ncbi:hypothetical protein EJ110_NYTH13708 [Nymphaea thermarum]|nr:hypothetical protein EJ110_NYTH13708 [Nymphaea thermarum]